MPWVDIPLATGQAEEVASGASYVSDAELQNLQFKPNPPGSRTPFHIASVPTLSTTGITTPGSGVIRGVQRGNAYNGSVSAGNKFVVVVQGTDIYYASPNTFTWFGPVVSKPGTRFCRMVDAGTHMVIVSDETTASENARCFDYSAAATQPSGVTAPTDATYQDGFTFYLKPSTGAIYSSDLDDPTTVDALNFTTVDALPGSVQALASKARELFVLCSESTQHYYNAGAGGFPMARSSPGLVEKGIYNDYNVSGVSAFGRNTLAEHGPYLYWLGPDCRVYRMAGLQPEALSTPWVERYIKANLSANKWGFVCTVDGLSYYMLSGCAESTTATTLVCDLQTGLWHKRKSPLTGGACLSYGVDTYGTVPKALVAANNANAGATSGTLYILDPVGTNDSGASSQTDRVMTLPQFAPAGGQRCAMSELFLDMQAPSTTGTMTVQWSDDGGTTWSSAVAGVTTTGGIRWQRLGMFRQRILRFNFQVASKIAIMGARARVEAAA
jgi:hypothetical protein